MVKICDWQRVVKWVFMSVMAISLAGLVAIIYFFLYVFGIVGQPPIVRYDPNSKYSPVPNLHPQHFITFEGHVAKRYVSNVRFHWVVAYEALAGDYNKHCRFVDDNWDQEWGRAEASENYISSYDANGNYNLKIPIDGFKPGLCNWRSITIGYNVTFINNSHKSNLGWGGIGIKSKHISLKSHHTIVKYRCYKKKFDNKQVVCQIKDVALFNERQSIARNIKDLRYQVDIEDKV